MRYAQARWLAWHSTEWEYLKAQCYAESALNPQAASAYAQGLCQFTPETWAYISRLMGMQTSIWSTTGQIYAAAFYMSRLLKSFWGPPVRGCLSRYEFAWGAYNAGMANILSAQRRAGGATDWSTVREHAPKETRDYIDRIKRLRGRMGVTRCE